MNILYVKALHIIFIVCWFAALFYIVRLFIYTSEAQTKDETAKSVLTQQLVLMQKRLWYIIGWPALVGTWLFGLWLMFANFSYYMAQPWMWLKLIAVVVLTIYHFACQKILSQQAKDIFKHSSFRLRLFNEIATVLLVAIVFLVVVKSSSGLLWGTLGLIALGAILAFASYIYKKKKIEEN